MAYDSQIVRANENLKFSHCGHNQVQASGTNPQIDVLSQGHYWVWCLIHHNAMKEETMAINQKAKCICRKQKINCIYIMCLLDNNLASSSDDKLVSGFPTRYDSFWPAQLQSLARLWKIRWS